jgi:S1-C subfamily serine protease
VALSVDVVRRMLAAPELAWTPPPARPAEPEREQLGSGFRVWFGSIPSYTFEGPGVLFDGISPGSPAEKAGLLPGDVLLAVGDVEIGDIYDFTYALQRYKAGDVVLARYLRDGEEQDVRMTLASRGIQ